MRRDRIPLKGAGEEDGLTAWRRLYCYTQRAGVTSWIKRGYRRRVRRQLKAEDRRDRSER